MKNLRKIGTALALVSIMIASIGCYGKFGLTKKIYTWNGTLGNKFVNSVIMWGLTIIPLYPVAFTADLIVFNTLEVLTGSNPIAMGPNDKEIQIVEKDGVKYQITATQNRFDIQVLAGAAKYKNVSLTYAEETSQWYSSLDGSQAVLIGEMTAAETLKLIHPENGKTVEVKL